MNCTKLTARTILAAVAILGGCATPNGVEDSSSTEGAIGTAVADTPYCETSDGKYRVKVALADLTAGAPQDAAAGPLVFSFGRAGDDAHTKNDAIVKLQHKDGSWVELRTTDDLVDGVDARPELLVRKSSNADRGVSARIVAGDLIDIHANFDKLGPDVSCNARLRVPE